MANVSSTLPLYQLPCDELSEKLKSVNHLDLSIPRCYGHKEKKDDLTNRLGLFSTPSHPVENKPHQAYVLPSFSSDVTLEAKQWKKEDIKVIQTSSKIHFLLFLPILGWMLYFTIILSMRFFNSMTSLNSEESVIANKLISSGYGISKKKATLLAKFIHSHHPEASPVYYARNGELGIDGSVPRDVMILPDGKVIVSVFNRIFLNKEMRIRRGLVLDPRQEKSIPIHLKETISGIEITDATAPMHISCCSTDVRPVNCYIIRHDSDLSKLYPLSLTAPGSTEDQYVDIAFFAYQRKQGLITKIVNLGQNLASKGPVNRAVTHVDFVRGRINDHELFMISAMGTSGTFKEYIKDIQKMDPGKELHIMRFRRQDLARIDPKALTRHMLDFATRQVNRLSSHLFLMDGADEAAKHIDTSEYIPGLYSYLDAMRSVFSRIRWNKQSISHLALSITDEILHQRRQTMDHSLLGGICSSFISLSYQVGSFLSAIGDSHIKSLYDDTKEFAAEKIYQGIIRLARQLIPLREKLKDTSHTELLDELNKLTLHIDYCCKQGGNKAQMIDKILTSIKTCLQLLEEHTTSLSQLISAKEIKQDKKLLQQIQIQGNKTAKTRLYQTIYAYIEDAETNECNLIHYLMKDPAFDINSRWVMPSTLHGIFAKTKVDTLQVVPPVSPS
ncbi:MAG: hypothetical protein HY860_01590 [Chlamydiales bacterium]|nr:hypothetical protein [Chlamydiales bacterium]